jgi:hypothetical protein
MSNKPESLNVDIITLDKHIVERFIHFKGCTVEELMKSAHCKQCGKTPIEIGDSVVYYALPDDEQAAFHLCKECLAKLKENNTITTGEKPKENNKRSRIEGDPPFAND